MTTRVRKVITAIDTNGNAFSEIHTETLYGEKWILNDPVSLSTTGPEADEWKQVYNATLESQRDSLLSQVKTLQIQVANLQAQVNLLN